MRLISPIRGQDFIWLAEYMDGTHLTEFDLDSLKENSFYSINKANLVKFGLIGHGLNLFFDVVGGYFHLQDTLIEFVLKERSGTEYPLTGNPELYNDIVTFKDAMSTFDPTGRDKFFQGRILKYNMGYKKSLHYEGLELGCRLILTVPFRQQAYFNIKLTPNREFTGDLLIKYSGRVVEALPCTFNGKTSYELNWVMK